jgi:hypothetical protein
MHVYYPPSLTSRHAPIANESANQIMPRRPSTIRLVEFAELLGVSKQCAHQIAGEPGFPAQLAEDARGRVWSRDEVQAWAKRWRREKPWRSRTS